MAKGRQNNKQTVSRQKRTAAGRETRMTKAERKSEREGNRETVSEKERSTGARQLLLKTEKNNEAETLKSRLAAQLQQSLCLYK